MREGHGNYRKEKICRIVTGSFVTALVRSHPIAQPYSQQDKSQLQKKKYRVATTYLRHEKMLEFHYRASLRY